MKEKEEGWNRWQLIKLEKERRKERRKETEQKTSKYKELTDVGNIKTQELKKRKYGTGKVRLSQLHIKLTS